ncbi:TetR/AcrR family transcriptional regulator [Williamsia sp.]|uniref:TetR/AcrR family transcriptional regulator n=1 Tax=Williamsia sp. TaxID=1872085 RepID=UPI001A26251E|nr:TetR/AcrR family transcriptional regulator [Williamsia sp.]MBJ7291501.1 TetR/AcrR family transcriptional regulator [Williamsia sp.]
MTGPQMTRPGGRTAEVRAAVLRATGDLLARHGFHGVDLATVARGAGVGKTTVYRRWGSPSALVADLLTTMAAESVARTDTGTLHGDLTANATLVQTTLNDPRQGRLFKALFSAATYDEHTAAALAEFYRTRVAEWAHAVTDAVARGEAPIGTDPVATISHLSAPLYYRFLTTTEPLADLDVTRAVGACSAAIAAGVFVVDE